LNQVRFTQRQGNPFSLPLFFLPEQTSCPWKIKSDISEKLMIRNTKTWYRHVDLLDDSTEVFTSMQFKQEETDDDQ
jgi:hypothetical protein